MDESFAGRFFDFLLIFRYVDNCFWLAPVYLYREDF